MAGEDTLTNAYKLPRMTERGVTQTLGLDIRNADDSVATITTTGSSITIKDGTRTIVDAQPIVGGIGATFSLAGSVTTDESLSDRYLEFWTVVIGGATFVFRRPGYLVRNLFRSTITDRDLIDRYHDLVTLRPTDVTTFQKWRDLAEEDTQRRLIMQGRRPSLVIDSWALARYQVYKALEQFFDDSDVSLADERYADARARFEHKAEKEWAQVNFLYDEDQDGVAATDNERRSSSAVLFLQPRNPFQNRFTLIEPGNN